MLGASISDLSTMDRPEESQNQQEESQGYQPNLDEESDSSPPAKKKRGTKDIMTRKVAAALDVSKISGRNAVRLITSILEVLDLDIDDFKVSRGYIQKRRNFFRK